MDGEDTSPKIHRHMPMINAQKSRGDQLMDRAISRLGNDENLSAKPRYRGLLCYARGGVEHLGIGYP